MTFGPITLDHIGIATQNFDQSTPFWSLLGLVQAQDDERVDEQGVVTRFFATDDVDDRPPAKSNCSNQQGQKHRLAASLNDVGQGSNRSASGSETLRD